MTITSPSEKVGVTPDLERADIIAGYRAFADLLEQVPELPVKKTFGWAVGGGDAIAVPAVEAAVKALADAGVDHTYRAEGNGITLTVVMGAVRFQVTHCYDQDYAAHMARCSYESVVQVDADQAEAVA